MREWADAAEVLANLSTAAAILIGGTWTYFKFMRGRTFANRAELALTGTLYNASGHYMIRVVVALKNTGLSRVNLRQDRKIVRLYGVERSEVFTSMQNHANVRWEDLVLTPVLEQHRWVEPQESIHDDVLIPVPLAKNNDTWLAYRLDGEVWAEGTKVGRKRTRWGASLVLPGNPVGLALQPDASRKDSARIDEVADREGVGDD
jgi:hypothetical protein